MINTLLTYSHQLNINIEDETMTNIHALPKLNDDTHTKIERYREIDQKIKALTKDLMKELETLKKELKEGYFFDKDEYIYNGRLLMTCDTQIRESIDKDELRKKRPDIYNLFQIETVSRVLRLK